VNSYLADNTGNSKGTGSMLITSVGNNNSQPVLPKDYELQIQNYPNPFNPTTTIVFSIPQWLANQKVELKIFNITGEQVASLLSKELQSGNYLVKWNGKDQLNQNVSSGIYFYQLKAGTHFKAGKMNLIK
jgi:flagellar hook assembly protein FlgD